MKKSSLLASELERAKRKKQALERLLETGKISQITYDKFMEEIDDEIGNIEERKSVYSRELAQRVKELENLIEIMKQYQAKVQIGFSAGEISEQQFKREKEIFESGTKELRREMESLQKATRRFARKVRPEEGFLFYEGIGKPTGRIALSLEHFGKEVEQVPIISLEFHQERGDFARWIREIFGDHSVADKIEKIKEKGEKLRGRIVATIEGSENSQLSPCPNCGERISAKKTWKMTGRPSKAGKRVQLTIGHYRCRHCDKSFRRVIAKEAIWDRSSSH